MNRRMGMLAACVAAGLAATAVSQNQTVVFQQGVNGYTGCRDKELREQNHNYYAKVPPSADVMLVITGCPSCPTARAAVKFDLTSIPTNAVIVSARLEMWAFWKNGTNAYTIAAGMITRPWSDVNATWTQRDIGQNWSTPGGDYGRRVATFNGPPGYIVNVWDSYDVTSAVQQFVADPSSNHGLLFICTGGADGHGYRTADYGTVSQRPKLTVVYNVPTHVGGVKEGGVRSSEEGLRILRDEISAPDGIQFSVLQLDGRCVSSRGAVQSVRNLSGGTYVMSMMGKRGNWSITFVNDQCWD